MISYCNVKWFTATWRFFCNWRYQNGVAPGWPGLHAFSGDGGVTWHVSKQVDGNGAYSFEVEWQEPALTVSTVFDRRERPELTVDPVTFTPMWLNTGCQLKPSNVTKSGNNHQYSFVVVQKVRQAGRD